MHVCGRKRGFLSPIEVCRSHFAFSKRKRAQEPSPHAQQPSSHVQRSIPYAQQASPRVQRPIPRAQEAISHAQRSFSHAQQASPHAQRASPRMQQSIPCVQEVISPLQEPSPHAQEASPRAQRPSVRTQRATIRIRTRLPLTRRGDVHWLLPPSLRPSAYCVRESPDAGFTLLRGRRFCGLSRGRFRHDRQLKRELNLLRVVSRLVERHFTTHAISRDRCFALQNIL